MFFFILTTLKIKTFINIILKASGAVKITPNVYIQEAV